MPIKPFTSLPKDLVEWGKFFRQTEVSPTPGSVDDDSFGNRSAASVIGNPTGGAAKPVDIVASSDNVVLRRSGGVLSFSNLVDADIPAGIARDSEVTAAIGVHEAAADPHPQYTTAAELSAALDAYFESATYTATLTGCLTSPTGDIRLVRSDNIVVAYIPIITATSNTTDCTLTGTMPVGFRPARTQDLVSRAMDNGANGVCGYRINTSGLIELFFGASLSVFTNSGTKGVNRATIYWSID